MLSIYVKAKKSNEMGEPRMKKILIIILLIGFVAIKSNMNQPLVTEDPPNITIGSYNV